MIVTGSPAAMSRSARSMQGCGAVQSSEPAMKSVSGAGHGIAAPRAQRVDAARIERDGGAEVGRRPRAILPSRDRRLLRVFCVASTVLPPCDQPSAAMRSGATSGARLQIEERTLRVRQPIRRRDRRSPERDRADLLAGRANGSCRGTARRSPRCASSSAIAWCRSESTSRRDATMLYMPPQP